MSERLYRIHVAAQLVGVSENLLRAWERRYRVVEPRRSPKGYRGYTPGDVELLRRVRQLTQEGVAIGDVVPLLPRLRREVREGLPERVPAPRADASGRAEQWVDALLAAVAESSQQKIDAVLDEALAALPALQVHEAVMMPAEREVGDRWHRGELSVAQEHLLSNAVRERLVTLVHGAPRPTGRHAICACFPEEQHELGLLGAALRFRHEGWRVTYLGARVPLEHLAENHLAAAAGAGGALAGERPRRRPGAPRALQAGEGVAPGHPHRAGRAGGAGPPAGARVARGRPRRAGLQRGAGCEVVGLSARRERPARRRRW